MEAGNRNVRGSEDRPITDRLLPEPARAKLAGIQKNGASPPRPRRIPSKRHRGRLGHKSEGSKKRSGFRGLETPTYFGFKRYHDKAFLPAKANLDSAEFKEFEKDEQNKWG